MRDQHSVAAEIVKGRQYRLDVGLPAHHVIGDAVDADSFRSQKTFRIDQLVEVLVTQQAAVDNPHGTDLDDLVAGCRLQAGSLGIEYCVRQIRQRAVQIDALILKMKQVEVVILRANARLVDHLPRHPAIRRGHRQDEAEERTVGSFFPLVPDFSPMAVDDIAQRQWGSFLAHLHGFGLPGVGSLRGHGVAGPDEIQVGQLAERQEAEAKFLDLVVVDQAGGEKTDREDQRKALRPQPQGFLDLLRFCWQPQLLFNSPLGGSDDVDAQHVLEWPAGFQRIGKLGHRLVQTLAHADHFVADDADETLADLEPHIGIVHQLSLIHI